MLMWFGALAGAFGMAAGLYAIQKDRGNAENPMFFAANILFALAVSYFTGFLEKGPFTNWWGNTWGPVGNIAVVAALAILGDYLMRKYGITSNQTTNTTKGDLPWTSKLPSQSVFILVSTVGMLSVGLNMALNGPVFQSLQITSPASVTQTETDLQNNLVPGQTLTGDLTGKIFINPGTGTTPSKVLYFVTNPDSSLTANVVTIGLNGVLSPLPPNFADVPFFIAGPNGTVVSNPAAGGVQTAAQSALLAVANTPQLASSVKQAAALTAAATDKYVTPVKLN